MALFRQEVFDLAVKVGESFFKHFAKARIGCGFELLGNANA
jgi:hypothetical protein